MRITLEELNQKAKEIECDVSRLQDNSVKTSEYFNEYSKLLSFNKLELKKLERKLRVLYFNLELYYSGKAPASVYQENPQPLKIMKTDLDKFIRSNSDYIKLEDEVETQKEIVDRLSSILTHLKDRTFAIKNAIEFLKFTSGN